MAMDITAEAQALKTAAKDMDGVTASKVLTEVGGANLNDLMQAYYKQADVPPLVITNSPDANFAHVDVGVRDSGPNRPTTILPLVKDLILYR
jgi:hypothetical protein